MKHATSGKGSVRSLEQFAVGADKEGFRQKGMANFTDEQCREIQTVVNMLPFMDFKVQVGVMNYEEEDGTVVFEDIAVHGDVITVYIELTYAKPATSKNRQIVHAPFFPVLVEDAWQLSLTQADNDFCINSVKVSFVALNVIAFEKMRSDQGVNDDLLRELEFLVSELVRRLARR